MKPLYFLFQSAQVMNQSGKATNGMMMNRSASIDDDFIDADGKKNKKKKRMQKLDPTLLGFSCNAAPELLNRAGEIESIADIVKKK